MGSTRTPCPNRRGARRTNDSNPLWSKNEAPFIPVEALLSQDHLVGPCFGAIFILWSGHCSTGIPQQETDNPRAPVDSSTSSCACRATESTGATSVSIIIPRNALPIQGVDSTQCVCRSSVWSAAAAAAAAPAAAAAAAEGSSSGGLPAGRPTGTSRGNPPQEVPREDFPRAVQRELPAGLPAGTSGVNFPREVQWDGPVGARQFVGAQAGPGWAGPGRAGPGWARPGRAEPGRAGPGARQFSCPAYLESYRSSVFSRSSFNVHVCYNQIRHQEKQRQAGVNFLFCVLFRSIVSCENGGVDLA